MELSVAEETLLGAEYPYQGSDWMSMGSAVTR
jgi:hypothetical protein